MRRILVVLTLTALCAATGSAQKSTSPDAQLGAIIRQAEVELDFEGAIPRYTKFIAENGTNAQLAAKALYHLGLAYEKVGSPEARTAFERVVTQFGTQKEAPLARVRLESGVARETTVKISGNDNIDRFFHPSPDGRYLVGPRPGEGNGKRDLVLHDLSTNADRRLTRGGWAFSAQFTPDGRRVVFQWAPSYDAFQSEGIHEIRMVNVDGTGERTIFRSSLYKELEVSGVAADGKTAAVGFRRTDDTWQVGLVSLETGKVTPLKNNEWRDTYVGNFSPDGRWLVYWMQREKGKGDGGIYALATDGSGQHPLIPGRAAGEAPYFTPDGSRVVFVSAGHEELWSIRVADGKPVGAQEIVSRGAGGGFTQLLGFSRDGSLYFTQEHSHESVFVADVNPANWKSLGAPTEVSTASAEMAGWSRDGEILAYQSVQDRSRATIVLHRFDSTPDRELSFTKPVTLHRWASDGRLLISSGEGLNFYDVDTGREQLFLGEIRNFGNNSVTAFGTPEFSGSIAMDESAVYYYTQEREAVAGQLADAHIVRLMRLDMHTGERRELHHLVIGKRPPRLYRLQVSPDGRSLAFGFPNPGSGPDSPSQSAVLVPLSGGEPRPLPGFAAWTPDSRAVLFEKSRGDIWVQPIDGGEMYSTGIRFDKSWDELGVVVHPDGRHIAMRWRVNTHDVAVMRNLLSKR